MKQQLLSVLGRLKNPSVVISIASQVVSVLVLFNIDVDRSVATALITTVCSVLVLLGIMSNPDTQNKGYGDDFFACACCHEKTRHLRVGGSMVCASCGCINNGELPQPPTVP